MSRIYYETGIETPETLMQCMSHYVPPNKRYINCERFGYSDGMDGGCWWCKEMTPYRWHMCRDEGWVRRLLSPLARVKYNSREDAIAFIEEYKQSHALLDERFEMTWPDCPKGCANLNENKWCEYANRCVTKLADDEDCRVGMPSKYMKG